MLAVFIAAIAFVPSQAVRAADMRVTLTLDGRPISSRPATALMRGGVLFVDAVDMTRVFDGLLVFEKNGIRISVRGHSESFRIGQHVAVVDDTNVKLQAAPFEYNGDIFVPLSTIIGADPALRVTWVNQHHADLHINAF
jgi:hypothetical protein